MGLALERLATFTVVPIDCTHLILLGHRTYIHMYQTVKTHVNSVQISSTYLCIETANNP